jgi:hypothetical protein
LTHFAPLKFVRRLSFFTKFIYHLKLFMIKGF